MSLDISSDTVAAATRGEAAAIRSLIDALQRPFYNLALRMLASHADAEDVTQEALLVVVTHLGSFRGESRFTTWAWTIATRVVLEQRRKAARQPIPIEAFQADLAAGRDDEAVERADDAVLLRQVKLGCGRAMLQCLDDDHRIAYTLGEILEVPGPQAAEAIGISPAAFRKRLSRARADVNTHLRRTCGLVDASAPCRCHSRIRPAKAMNRLEPRDAEGDLELPRVRALVAGVHALSRGRTYYQVDPQPGAPIGLVQRVRKTLGIGG